MKRFFSLLSLLFFIIPACTPRPGPGAPIQTSTTIPSPTASVSPVPTQSATPLPTATETPVPICLPFPDITLEQLLSSVSNPYDPPAIGEERVHQGLDFAQVDPISGIALSGGAVQSVFPGRVALVLEDRFPYGHAVLIETPLALVPLPQDALPEFPPEPLRSSNLFCPQDAGEYTFSQDGDLSLYLLYAHLEQLPVLSSGEFIEACSVVGQVGMTGNALNPHLHLEARIGPAGLSMVSMAHYDHSATLDEMANYCFWRVSGIYHFIDPLLIFPADD